MYHATRKTTQVPLLRRYPYGQQGGKEDQGHGPAEAEVLQEL